jgi:uncharacterized protein YycO
MANITLQFSTEKGIGSLIIRRMTWSEYSHVDIVMPNGDLLGARANGGVQIRKPGYGKFTKVHHEVAVDAPDSVYEFAKSQVGKPYDWKAILNFGLERNWQEDDSWFCSELVAWTFMKAGHPLLDPDVQLYRISPRDLLLSTALSDAD